MNIHHEKKEERICSTKSKIRRGRLQISLVRRKGRKAILYIRTAKTSSFLPWMARWKPAGFHPRRRKMEKNPGFGRRLTASGRSTWMASSFLLRKVNRCSLQLHFKRRATWKLHCGSHVVLLFVKIQSNIKQIKHKKINFAVVLPKILKNFGIICQKLNNMI